jgi:hypothetical protein
MELFEIQGVTIRNLHMLWGRSWVFFVGFESWFRAIHRFWQGSEGLNIFFQA